MNDALPSSPEELRREHIKTRLLALSLDGTASPSITLRALAEHEARDMPYGWGFAWYPEGSRAALVVKDPSSLGENAMTMVLRQWERFESTLFVCHLRGAARTLREQDTHPFARTYAGRDWVFAHNGDLDGDLAALLPLGDDPIFEPIGGTDSERAFAWLLRKVREAGARRLADVGWDTVMGWLRELDQLGTFNLLFTDGMDLVAYHDADQYNGLYYTRLLPPHEPVLRADDIQVALDDAGDRTRTVVALSTVALDGAEWTQMQGRQMIVARRGSIVFDSHRTDRPASIPAPGPVPPRVTAPLADLQREAASQQAAHGGVSSAPAAPNAGVPAPSPVMNAGVPAPSPVANAGVPASNAPSASRPAVVEIPAAPWGELAGSRVLSVVHETRYRYDTPVERSAHIYRLRPVHDRQQELLEHELSINTRGLRHDYEDVFGNATTRTEVETLYSELVVRSRSVVRVYPASAHDLFSPERSFSLPLAWMPWQRQMMLPYLLPPELPESQLSELYEYALGFVERQDHDLARTLLDINRSIFRDYAYTSGATNLATTPFDVYARREGVCQDFANLLICLARLLSIPARYRVGYIYTGANYENKVQSEASHAWAEVYIPWRGWVGFDPTNGVMAGLDHVRVACGRNYRDATPTSGTIYKGGGFETLTVDVKVEEVAEEG